MATSAAANPTRTPSGILTILGGILLLGMFAAIVVLWITSRGTKENIEEKRAAARTQARENLDKEMHEKLSTDAWVDKSKGIARITIADAVKLTVEDLKKKQVAPSTMKVEAPLPVPAPNPNEPPTPALPSAPQGAETFPFALPAAPAAKTEEAAPAAPAPAPAAPAPAASAPAPAPVEPAPAPAPAPAAPAAPAPEAQPAPNAASVSAADRQPLINWTETK